uniref:cytochrome oxidase subunit II n=1 Tax=Hapterophycus canaliculatus TaxID=2567908 RepID=UPI002E7684AE|nr:cytochrome oxidase subunit II [Hapterophycus canaliculatus]WBP70172.1 cytochrome oxidase subunit II [Hapterophycus canaliculatus]
MFLFYPKKLCYSIIHIMKIPFKNIFQIIPSSFSFFIKVALITFFFIVNTSTTANMDASHPWQIGFQDPATPIMEGIIFFNGLLMTFMIFIACLVGWLLYKSLTLFNESVHNEPVGFTHSTLLEVVWTIIPAAILMIISVPSYNLLYAMDEVIDPSLTIKIVGHQWYWSYECSDFEVAPHLQKVESPELNEARENLKSMVEILEFSNVEAERGEKQTVLITANKILKFLADEVENLPKDESVGLAGRLNYIGFLLQDAESTKETYENPLYGEILKILSSAKEQLDSNQLLPEQKEAAIKIIKIFKQYLRITEDSKLGVVHQSLIKSLVDLTSDDSPSSSGDEGSGSDNSFGSNDDSDGDDSSIVSDLTKFDEFNPFWNWCEYVSVKSKYDLDDATLTRLGVEALVSERTCNSAALFPEEIDTPFPELAERMKKDIRELRKFIPIADLSEDKLIDVQLIEHQLRLTRAEREGYSSKFAFDIANVAFNLADRELNTALKELNDAKLYLHWSDIELAAAKVNKLTAEYLQADASLGVTDPLLIRSLWINQKGYYSWHNFLRLAIKKLSDVERLVFLNADEKLNGANSLLGKAQRNLTSEERIRSNAIADNAKAQFLAMEREVIPAVEEFKRGKVILANAEAELKSFQDISDRATIRLEKAEAAFNKAKPIADRAKSKLNAVESIYKNAQSKLTSVDSIQQTSQVEEVLNKAQNSLEIVLEEFNDARLDVQNAKLELSIAEDRFKTVNINLEKTDKVFENTGILEKQTPVKDKPTEYYPNHLWEIHNEDFSFVRAQLSTDAAELEVANNSLTSAETCLNRVGGQLLESELNKSKAFIEVLKEDSDNLEALNNEIKHLSSIEFGIAEVIYTKALAAFESEGSKISELILDRAEKGLLKAKSNGTVGYLNEFLKNNFKDINSNELISEYAEICLARANEEIIDAEKDYKKASHLLDKTKKILDKVTFDLSKDYDNPNLETLRYLHKNTSSSLENRIEELRLTQIEFSPLDIKLESGGLQLKSYKEVVLAKAELANMKWLAARVAKTLDIPLCDEAKPFNVQFSHLSTDNSSIDNSSSYSEISSSSQADFPSDDSGDKIPAKPINDVLLEAMNMETLNNPAGFEKKIVHIFSELLKTVNKSQTNKLLAILDEAFSSMVEEAKDRNQTIERQLTLIKKEFAEYKSQEDEEVERINFDSYLIAEDDLVIPEPSGVGKAGKVFRLLEVDNRLFVPTNTHIRLLVTSADVLHSWAVPSLGIKVDACPGRLNQVFLFVKREGVFYGQCSELCGVNHGFMPIVVQAVSQDEYLTWVGKRLCS